MAKIQILGSAAVVTSSVKVADLETLRKFKPNALKLVDPETKDELFAISMTTNPSFTKFGAAFTGKDAEGKAQMTLAIPASLETADAKKAYVADTYGYALLNLNKLEEQIASVMTETADDFEAINAGISAQ